MIFSTISYSIFYSNSQHFARYSRFVLFEFLATCLQLLKNFKYQLSVLYPQFIEESFMGLLVISEYRVYGGSSWSIPRSHYGLTPEGYRFRYYAFLPVFVHAINYSWRKQPNNNFFRSLISVDIQNSRKKENNELYEIMIIKIEVVLSFSPLTKSIRSISFVLIASP